MRNFKPSSVTAQPGLCRTRSETPKTDFLTTRLIYNCPFQVGSSVVVCAVAHFGVNFGNVYLMYVSIKLARLATAKVADIPPFPSVNHMYSLYYVYICLCVRFRPVLLASLQIMNSLN